MPASIDYNWFNCRVAFGGEIASMYDARKLAADGITVVLNLRTKQDEVEFVQKAGMQYLSNPTSDDGKTDEEDRSKPASWFKSSFSAIMSALEQSNTKIYIHCQEGFNRAPSTVYFWLRALGMEKDEAYDAVVSARPKAKKGMRWVPDADAAIKQLGY
jgi:protein-tyrosine phosphatase